MHKAEIILIQFTCTCILKFLKSVLGEYVYNDFVKYWYVINAMIEVTNLTERKS